MTHATKPDEPEESPQALLAYFQRLTGNSPQALCQTGQNLAQAGLHFMAIEYFQRAVAEYPEYVAGWSDLGTCLSEMKRFDESEAALRKALDLAPEHFLAWGCLAEVKAAQKKCEAAFDAFSQFHRLAPAHPYLPSVAAQLLVCLAEQADELQKCGDWAAATACQERRFEVGTMLDSDSIRGDARFEQSRIRFASDCPDDGMRVLEEAEALLRKADDKPGLLGVLVVQARIYDVLNLRECSRSRACEAHDLAIAIGRQEIADEMAPLTS